MTDHDDRRADDSPENEHEGQLADAISRLAELPDDASALQSALTEIARLCVVVIPAVDYASITAKRGEKLTTVAMSSDVPLAVDEAQYAEGGGPCVDVATLEAELVSVDALTTLMNWPQFRETALALGLASSLSLALFAASGHAVAGLNLYSHESHAFDDLTQRLAAVYVPRLSTPPRPLDEGSEQLVSGMARALESRDVIQRAIGLLLVSTNGNVNDAYVRLRAHAAESGGSVVDAAVAVLASRVRGANGPIEDSGEPAQ